LTGAELIDATAEHVREQSAGEASGHDWWHVHRVWRNAQAIAAGEDVDPVVVELAALLHDIADWKFHDGDLGAGSRVARAWLTELGADAGLVDAVTDIIGRVSYRGAGVADEMPSLEGRVVHDADRLDAMGAIGIARAFAYGGHAGRPIHDPDIAVELHASAEAYVASRAGSLNHFPEKLLLLRDRMHTATARRIADERHEFMETFVARFLAEWEGLA
jgi:uncharacterized protein